MRSKRITSLLAGIVLCFSLSADGADVPGMVHHQGYLTDADGVPITGDVEVLFSIFDQETGGAELWSEGPMTVPVTDGVFQVVLGQTTPITPLHLAGPGWLEVVVDGEPLDRFVRMLVGAKETIVIDRQGRALIPDHLRLRAGLESDAMVVGCLDKVEIWDGKLYRDHMEDEGDTAPAASPPDSDWITGIEP